MVRLIAVAFLFCASTIANAQSEFRNIPKTVLCGPADGVFKALADPEINEKPVWLGKEDNKTTDYALFVNQQMGTFTIIQFSKNMACIIGIGNQSNLLPEKSADVK
jgi:hypothetical protein